MKILYFLPLIFLFIGQGFTQEVNGEAFKAELVAAFEPMPSWWEDVDERSVPLNNYKELLKFWQSDKRCCKKDEIQENNQIFVKTVYLRLKNGPFDKDLYAYGSKLLNINYIDHPRMLEIQEVVWKYFKNYKQPLDYCANCSPGDTSVGILSGMLKFYRQKGEYDKAIQMSLELLSRDDISNYKVANFINKVSYLYERQRKYKEAYSLVEKTILKYALANGNRAIQREIKYLEKRLVKLRRDLDRPEPSQDMNSRPYNRQNPFPGKKPRSWVKVKDNSFHFELDEKDIDEFLDRNISKVKTGVMNIFLIALAVVFGLVFLMALLYFYQQRKFASEDDGEKSFSDLED